MDFYSQTTSNQYDRTPNEGKSTAVVTIDWQRMRAARTTPNNPYGTENTDIIPKGALVFGSKATLQARTNLSLTPTAATASVAFVMTGVDPNVDIEKFNHQFHEKCSILGVAAYGLENSRLNAPASTPTSFTINNGGKFDYPAFFDVHAGQMMEAFWLKPGEYLEQRNRKFIGPTPVLQLRPIPQKLTARVYAPGEDLFQTIDQSLFEVIKKFADVSRGIDMNTVFSSDVTGHKIKKPLAGPISELCDLLIQRRIETTPTLQIRCVKGAPAGYPAQFVMH